MALGVEHEGERIGSVSLAEGAESKLIENLMQQKVGYNLVAVVEISDKARLAGFRLRSRATSDPVDVVVDPVEPNEG